MEVPPAYSPPPPRKSKTGLIIGLILGGIVLCCVLPIGGIVGLGYWGIGKMKGTVACAAAFGDLQAAIEDYSQDHNGKLPKAMTWMDDVRPYYQKRLQRHGREAGPFSFMPAEGDFHCDSDDGRKTGIAFNSDLSGKVMDDVKAPWKTVMLFETETPGTNLNRKYKPLDDSTSPKMLNKARGWMTAPVRGKPYTGKFDMETQNGNFNVKVDPDAGESTGKTGKDGGSK